MIDLKPSAAVPQPKTKNRFHHEGTKSTKFTIKETRTLRGFRITIARNLRGLRKVLRSRRPSDSDIPRAKTPRRKVTLRVISTEGRNPFRSLAFARDDGPRPVTLAPLRPVDVAQGMLCARYSESWLRRGHAGFSVGIFKRCASAPYPSLRENSSFVSFVPSW